MTDFSGELFRETSNSNGEVVDLATDENFLYATMGDGTIYKYDGKQWAEVKVPRI